MPPLTEADPLPADQQWMNARCSEFYISRWSEAQGRYISVGEPHRTVQSALKAARLAEQRNKRRGTSFYMVFVDSKRPA